LHLKPFFGTTPLTGITRELLIRYIDQREGEGLIRSGTRSKKKVARGTVSNELSLLHRTLTVAAREGLEVKIPSFEGLIVRTKRGGRALSVEEREMVLQHLPRWFARMCEFAAETGLSEGDILRLTNSMIDRKAGVIIPDGGRLKTQATTDDVQVAPLTRRCVEILDEIRLERKRGHIIANTNGVIFTRDDGRLITRDMI